MKFGLEVQIIENIISVLEQHPKVDKAFVFGSRAKGNYRPDSDIDIAIKGNEITTDDIIAISVAIETNGITHKFDLIDYNSIKEPALKEHIDRVGIEFYSRWKEHTLDSISYKITDGAHLSPKDFVNGRIMFSVKDMIDNGFDYSKPKTISHEDFNSLERQGCKPEIDDILIAKDGSVLKHIFRVTNEPNYVLLSSIAIIKPIKEKVDPSFLVYTLKSPIITDTILTNFVSGSGVPRIVLKDFKKVVVSLPPLQEQTAIASILSSLDDKIDLLNRQNKTLEQLAETLFRQLFVEEAEESWEVVKLEKLGRIICGKTPSKKIAAYFNGDIPFIKIPDMHGKTFVFDSVDSLTEKGLNSQLNKTIPPKSICVSCIATVGLVVMNAKTSQTNQQINSIIPAKDIYRYFIYLKMLTMKDDLLAMASGGTATDNLNTGDFSKIDILLPNENQLKKFHETVNPLFEKIYTNQTQIRTLTQTRDTLLPKLMSAEVRVEM